MSPRTRTTRAARPARAGSPPQTAASTRRRAAAGKTPGSARKASPPKRSGSKQPPARRRPRRRRDPILVTGFVLLARAAGFAVRHVGRGARDLDPDHRRDGAGLVCFAMGVVSAAGVWVRMDNPAGRAVYTLATGAFGVTAFTLPVLLALLGVRFMRHPDRDSRTSRAVTGWAVLLISLLGLVSLATGTSSGGPRAARAAGGLAGYAVSAPLSAGVTRPLAALLLVMAAGFGLLVITGTPVRRVPARLGLGTDPAAERADTPAAARQQVARNIRLKPATAAADR